MIVIDSSAVVDLAFGREDLGSWVAEQLDIAEALAAPHILDVEVLGACRSLEQRDVISEREARVAVDHLGALAVTRYPHLPLRERMWELRHHVTAPDAAYVALAEALAVPLVTTDRRLSRTHGVDCDIVAP